MSYDPYVLYCPRCGEVSTSYQRVGDYCDCTNFFTPKFIRSPFKTLDFDLSQPRTSWGATKEMYLKISEECVKIPSNKKYNAEAHRKILEKRFAYLDAGGYDPSAPPKYKCPKCGFVTSGIRTGTQGFSKGNAVAGAVAGAAVAGPIGLAGAAVGLAGKNKQVRICPACGHKW